MHTIVIFGASGDLTSRKLIPALYSLYRKKRLPEPARVVGFSRTPMSDEQWREKLAETTGHFAGGEFTSESWQAFAQSVYYQRGDIGQAGDFASLASRLEALETGVALPPVVGDVAALRIGDAALASNPSELFCEIGMSIKRASPFPWTGIAGYTDGSVGYIPTRSAYPEGGYEVDSACRVNPEAGEMIEEACLRLLRSLA